MIYTDLTKKAMMLCFEKHINQKDKSGIPYIFHVIHVAEQMNDEYSVCSALLHDIIEDTDVTGDELLKAGFPSEVVNAVELLTKTDNIPYFDYINGIKNNDIAKSVKIADLRHNSDMTRLNDIGESDRERLKKYKAAIDILLS